MKGIGSSCEVKDGIPPTWLGLERLHYHLTRCSHTETGGECREHRKWGKLLGRRQLCLLVSELGLFGNLKDPMNPAFGVLLFPSSSPWA